MSLHASDNEPIHWGSLGPEFALCDKGMAQSPVDLLRSRPLSLDAIEFSYKDAPFDVINNGHTLEELEPISETVKSRYPKHGQTVLHFDKDSTIFLDGDLYLLEQFHFHAPKKAGEFIGDLNNVINPVELLPKRRSYYSYFGSYTTPPCHEGVLWTAMHDPIEVSVEQIQQFRSLVGHDNARPTSQPLHKRFVLESNYAETAAQLK